VIDPPADGTTGAAGEVLTVTKHPPLVCIEVSHAAKAASRSAWLWHDGSVRSTGQITVIVVALATSKVEVQLTGPFESVTSYVKLRLAPSQ
jgi:hypothetical protein